MLEVRLLGQFQIQINGEKVDITSRAEQSLLAYLIMNTGTDFRREHLAGLFWPDSEESKAKGYLRLALWRLRKAIHEVSPSAPDYFQANKISIAFDPAQAHHLDCAVLEDESATSLEELLITTQVYTGELLPGFYDEWVLLERERLRAVFNRKMQRLLEQLQSTGRWSDLIRQAERWISMGDHPEPAYRGLILGHAELGNLSGAQSAYERCVLALQRDLGLEPSAETRTLFYKIQTQQHTSPVWGSNHRAKGNELGPSSMMIGVNLQEPAFYTVTGKEVTILEMLPSKYLKLLKQSMEPLETRSGIRILYLSADDQLETELAASLRSGNAPDIVAFPTPGILAKYARQGKVVDVRTFLEDDYLQQHYPAEILEMATVDGTMMGVWHTIGLKSLVWYPKQAFEARGFEVPKTWDELIALSNQIVVDGATPWCIGIKAGKLTGWIGTDWVEDILLRTASPDTYDAWVEHELPFNSPEIRRVFEIMGQIWLNDDYVYGGKENILTEPWYDSFHHLFENPPGCYLYKQASWAPISFPKTVTYGKDYDFFYLPPIDPEFGKPVLAGGDIFAMFNDRPEVREVMRYLTTAESVKSMIPAGYLSPYKETPIEWYTSDANLRFAHILLSADTYRFDGADLMPKEVGKGSFYQGIVDWVKGADLDEVLQKIDDSWPR